MENENQKTESIVSDFAERSPGIAKISEALAKAQAIFKEPRRSGKVDFRDKNDRRIKYVYATLSDLTEVIKKPLADNGLSYTHLYAFDKASRFGVKTVLAHTSGEFISSFLPMPDAFKSDIKSLASQTTYLKRYSLSALLGIPADTDDDGGPPTPQPKPVPPQRPAAQPIATAPEPKPIEIKKANMGQIKRLQEVYTAKGYKSSQVATISVALFQAASPRDLTSDQIEDLTSFCEKNTVDDASAELMIKLV